MPDETLQEYFNLIERTQKLESELEEVSNQRNVLSQKLFERDGKGHVYNFNGTEMIIMVSSKGKHFFTPKNKRGRKKGSKNAVKAAPKQDAPKQASRIVDVSAEVKTSSKVSNGDPLAAALAEAGTR